MPEATPLPAFDRRFLEGTEPLTRIGRGSIGGKAVGLALMRDVLARGLGAGAFPAFSVDVPRMAVVSTDYFDRFIAENRLDRLPVDTLPDEDIARAFQRADLPADLAGDLRALAAGVRSPLAVRSSSLLEDDLNRPFAGVYGTKMIPNHHVDPDSRFRFLVEAVKFVWASTWLRNARDYLRAAGRSLADEKMAVIVQEIVGRRHRGRFYPEVSGVARSYNFYPFAGSRPDEGVVHLALGLGKTIVDGGLVWTFSPAAPARTPPFADLEEMLAGTQTRFWAVNMDNPPAYDPVAEVEYLVSADLASAREDETLKYVASIYDAGRDRLSYDLSARGPVVVNFAPLLVLNLLPVATSIRMLLDLCEQATGSHVEMEFALTFDPGAARGRLGFLQVRPMVASEETVDVTTDDLAGDAVVAGSEAALGNGVDRSIRDVVYVRPDTFSLMHTRAIAAEIEALNRELADSGRPYLLIGFGRWGSSHPTLGIPVVWSQIAGARAIVEASLPRANFEPSQGSHFFHNLSSFRVSYFTVRDGGPHPIRWDWLDAQRTIRETALIRHVRLDTPLEVRVDGRTARGVIRHH
jgi:hypothetical protein